MTRFETWLLHLSNLLVGGTGLVYAWLRYVAESPDPYSAVHPWQPPVQHAHVLAAPLLVFALGLIARHHAWAGLRLGMRSRRRSGLLLLALAAPMILSGYLLQTTVTPTWHTAWIALHLATSALWLLATATHLISRGLRG